MRKPKAICVVVAVCTGMMAIISCSDSPAGSTNSIPSQEENSLYYFIHGDTLYFYSPAGTISSNRYCNGDSLVTSFDTSEGDTFMYFQYQQTGSTLLLIGPTDTIIENQNATVYKPTYTLTANNHYAGLDGIWNFETAGVILIVGIIGDSLQAQINEATQDVAGEYVQFDHGKMTSGGMNEVSNGEADFFIEMWNGYYGIQYDITVTKINSMTVRMVGNKNAEIVTIVWNNKGDETYSSSVVGHLQHTYYNEPTSCPNDYRPVWYNDFLIANPKIGPVLLLKRKEINSDIHEHQKHRKLPGFLLKR